MTDNGSYIYVNETRLKQLPLEQLLIERITNQGRWLFRGQHTAGKCTLNVVFKRNNASNLWTTFLVKYDSEDGVAENLYPVDKRNIKHYRTRVESLGGLLDRVQEYGDLRLEPVFGTKIWGRVDGQDVEL